MAAPTFHPLIHVDSAAEDQARMLVSDMLVHIGEDVGREGLRETPARVVRSWRELYAGYGVDPASLMTTFTEGACREMIILRRAEFFSTCEHHLLPFYGTVSIGYLPAGRVIGLSKLARLVEIFARRLQIQERMTAAIADAIVAGLTPEGAMVVCRARHLCMMARGVRQADAEMVTSAIRGTFERESVRQEFMALEREGG